MKRLAGKRVLITGASTGIGYAVAKTLAARGAHLGLFSRTESRLSKVAKELAQQLPDTRILHKIVDIQDYGSVKTGVDAMNQTLGGIDVLINNAGLALGVPSRFQDLSVSQITKMNDTNITGMMLVTHAVLNSAMIQSQTGVILNISSSTGLEVPTTSGKVVYHANKAAQEAFSNALRNELSGTDIKVLVVRPGFVQTEFHRTATGVFSGDDDQFFDGYTPLKAQDVADSVAWMLDQPSNISIKALDVVPTAQRSIAVFDRTWNTRHKR